MDRLTVGGRGYALARAVEADVRGIVALLGDDVLGSTREAGAAGGEPDLGPYLRAFRAIDADDHHLLLVVHEDLGDLGDLVATMQLTVVPGLSRGGATRLQVEAVRVAAAARGTGLGTALFSWAHSWGRARGATLAQLTTDKSRADAHRFYVGLGYDASHEGFKRVL